MSVTWFEKSDLTTLNVIYLIPQATVGWDPGMYHYIEVHSHKTWTKTVFSLVTGLGTPNFEKLKALVT